MKSDADLLYRNTILAYKGVRAIEDLKTLPDRRRAYAMLALNLTMVRFAVYHLERQLADYTRTLDGLGEQ